MNISEITSQIAINRQHINNLHDMEEFYTLSRTNCSRNGMPLQAEFHDKHVMKAKKKIARLVVLQKSLKQELQYTYEHMRLINLELELL